MIDVRKIIVALVATLVSLPALAREAPISFSEDVQPVLQIRCTSCHQPGAEGYEKSGFDLTSYDGLMKGTQHGPMVVPGDPVTSNLMVLIDGKADKSLQMPHGKKKLSSCDRDTIRRWIKQGAKNN
jgi:Planctomycete cytochrome C.